MRNKLIAKNSNTLDTKTSLTNYLQHFKIHTEFEMIAELNPDTTALIFGEHSMTYDELNKKANRLAHFLIEKGVAQDEIIAVKLDRGLELIVALLGIMKAGAAYMPIDPSYPTSRIAYMLDDSGARYVVTKPELMEEQSSAEQINILGQTSYNSANPNLPYSAHSLAYMIYTSGTTGTPKGVMVEHKGFVNMCLSQIITYQLGLGERVLQFASISFDASVYEIFITLLSGATLVLISYDNIINKDKFLEYVDRHELTFLLLPPVFLNSLGRPLFESVKTIVTAGEACNIGDAVHYSKTKRFFNAYGPTEASVCVSLYQVSPTQTYENYMPIGKAIPNMKFYIMDENMKPVKKGEPGELCVAGIGLARKYNNKPELTQKAFIYSSGQRLYKTGDIVKQLEDGNLIVFGRRDNQVKISGHRIELGAIEYSMNQLDGIKNALVCPVQNQNDKLLCAYYTTTTDLDVETIREQLLLELPHFMVPHMFIQVAEFRMTKNGKIDKDALPNPFDHVSLPLFANTQENDTLATLLKLCQEVLGHSQISPENNFFLIGGHSLKAAALSVRIHKCFNTNVPVSEIYKHPKISELADYISAARRSEYKGLSRTPLKRFYATSAAQKRMYMMYNTDKVDVSYNVSIVLQFDHVIPASLVHTAVKLLTQRHEVLRTRFDIQYDEIVQEVVPEVEVVLEHDKISAQDMPSLSKSFVRPFDLSSAPVLRVGYWELHEGGIAVVFDTHHIIADGTSMGILVQEFVQLLKGEELPALEFQYKDYAEWEHVHYNEASYFNSHKTYWTTLLKNCQKLQMPIDYPSQTTTTKFEGARLSMEFPKELSVQIDQYTSTHNLSTYQLLLAGYSLVLSKYSLQNDVVVGSAVANRGKEEIQNMLGMFVNILPIRIQIPEHSSFAEYAQSVKARVLEAFEHQEYPFESLVAELGLSGTSTKIPIIDTLFMVQNINFFNDSPTEGLRLKYENATATSKFDFSFFVTNSRDSYKVDIEYNTQLYREETMKKLFENYMLLLKNALNTPYSPLEEISMTDASELSQIKQALKQGQNQLGNLDFDF